MAIEGRVKHFRSDVINKSMCFRGSVNNGITISHSDECNSFSHNKSNDI
jgi:hypothetical protein